jgi:hypothetical protein
MRALLLHAAILRKPNHLSALQLPASDQDERRSVWSAGLWPACSGRSSNAPVWKPALPLSHSEKETLAPEPVHITALISNSAVLNSHTRLLISYSNPL